MACLASTLQTFPVLLEISLLVFIVDTLDHGLAYPLLIPFLEERIIASVQI